jgi:hypothetical protein
MYRTRFIIRNGERCWMKNRRRRMHLILSLSKDQAYLVEVPVLDPSLGLLMMPDHFLDHEAQELFGKLRI